MGGRDAERDVTHVVIDTGGVLFHEGQSFGVVPPVSREGRWHVPPLPSHPRPPPPQLPLPPRPCPRRRRQGTKLNSKGKEVPETVRLYSIASSRYGDRHDGTTCTLCVVRVVYTGAWRAKGAFHKRSCILRPSCARGTRHAATCGIPPPFQCPRLCALTAAPADPKTGEEKRGVCSNYISDRKVGDTLTMTGPAGTVMVRGRAGGGRRRVGHCLFRAPR